MNVIDIFKKIANGEQVRFRILDNDEIRDEIFEVENGQLRNSTCGKWIETKVSSDTWESISRYFLNEEVELIEEEKKIPEKLDIKLNSYDENKVNCYSATNLECDLAFKINGIIDYLKSKGE